MAIQKKRHPVVNITKNGCARATDQKQSWEDLERQAEGALSPTLNGAAVTQTFTKQSLGEVDVIAVVSALKAQIADIKNGDMSEPEAMLFSQAAALQSIFVGLARKASNQTSIAHYQVFLTLALKAQAQCRCSLEALNEMKFPKSATFVKQANIANQQQINNGVSSHAEKKTESANELLHEASKHGLVGSPAQAAGGSNHALETVEQIDGAKNTKRKSSKRAELPQARE